MLYKIARPVFFLMDPERIHDLIMLGLKVADPFLPMLSPVLQYKKKDLEKEVLGLTFPNPLGLAAGFDKDATCVSAWPSLGFGFMELGTFTARAQPGNSKPRIFRYPKYQAVINRCGFNNGGAEAAAGRLARLSLKNKRPSCPIGINIGKNKDTPLEKAHEDYLFCLEKLRDYADYIAVNVSSPNTPDLRKLQQPVFIKDLVRQLTDQCFNHDGQKIPLLVKFDPDTKDEDLLASVDAALEGGASGLVLTNTSLNREVFEEDPKQAGGLSGAPLRERSLKVLETVAKHTEGRVPIIGSGAVFTAEDVRRKMDAGASLVQAYTGFIYQGPTLAKQICSGLSAARK